MEGIGLNMKNLAILALAACTTGPGVSLRTAELSSSERVTIQAQIDAACAAPDGGTVLLSAGRHSLDRAPVGSFNRFAALSLHCRNVTIRGVGWETVLQLTGDQGGQSVALLSIDPSAEHIMVADLTMDLSGTTNTDEQTHGIATSGVCAPATATSPGTCFPIRDLVFDHVRIVNPRNTTTRKGDCIKLLGAIEPVAATATMPAIPGTEVSSVRIIGSSIGDEVNPCARSSVMVQGGVHDVLIIGDTMAATKTCLDGEATGGRWDSRIVITANTTLPGCSPAVSLTNFASSTLMANALSGNLTIYRSTNVAVTGNTIDFVGTGDTAAIDVANVCDGLSIVGNPITRSGFHGPAIKLVPHSGGVCQHASIIGNPIKQMTADHGIHLESVSNVEVALNRMTFAGAPGFSAIYERAVVAGLPITGVMIVNNQADGPIAYGVQLHAGPGTFGAGVSVRDNQATDAAFSVYLNNPGGFSSPVQGE